MNKIATPKIVVKLVTVTPDMAIEMLEKNNMNRNIDHLTTIRWNATEPMPEVI